jgi:hypothetical protein
MASPVPRLADRQRAISAAVLDHRQSAPPGLVGPDGEPSARRFGVYRNNIAASLVEALADMFPAVSRIVGDEFFRAMAREYALQTPPSTPILLAYGATFPDFITSFAPAKSVPYLADVARIERAWIEAYHAADASPIPPSAFAEIASDRAAEFRLRLHPSLRIVRSHFPALTIWRMNIDEGVPQAVDLGTNEDTLVIRPEAEVEVRSMPPGGAEFLESLRLGHSIGDATTTALNASGRFDVTENLVALVRAQVFVGYDVAE